MESSTDVFFQDPDGGEVEGNWPVVPPCPGDRISLRVDADYAPPGMWSEDVQSYWTRHYRVLSVAYQYEKHYTRTIKYRTFVIVTVERIDR